MFRVLYCLQTQHNPLFVTLAAAVCLGGCLTAVFLLSRARQSEDNRRMVWLGISGSVLGFSIWATHFIAMLAYSAGVKILYDLPLTLASLVFAAAMTSLGMGTAIGWRSRTTKSWAVPLGGALTGVGISGMHFMGMSGLRFAGHIDWAWDLVAVSVAVSIVFSVLFFHLLRTFTSVKGQISAALSLVLAIAGLHFIAMGAVIIVPDPTRAFAGQGISQSHMSIVISLLAFMISAISLTAAIYGRRRDLDVEASERNFAMLIEAVSDYAICTLDTEGRVSNWNTGARRIKGYAPEEIIGQHVSIFYPTEAGASAYAALERALKNGRFSEEGLRVRKNGEIFWAQVVITPIFDHAGTHVGFATITRDISEQKAAQDSLLKLKNTLDAAINNMSQGLSLFDADQRLRLYNPRMGEILGIKAEQLAIGTRIRDILRVLMTYRLGYAPDPDRIEERYALHLAAMQNPDGGRIEFEADGRVIVLSYRPLPEGGWVVTADDITERLANKKRIDYLARHDKLTGLANRDDFNKTLTNALHQAEKSDRSIVVACIDIEQFATVNDHYGHEVGDQVLCELARRLKDHPLQGMIAARLGGDEFALFWPVQAEAQPDSSLREIIHTLSRPIMLQTTSLSLCVRMGCAIAPLHGADHETLINNAKLAQNRARESIGTEAFCFYESGMDEASRQRRLLAADLRQALARNEFRLYYQVQKSVITDEITGYEALIRWSHPQRGMVSPVDFIPIAEETGAIVEIGEWVLRKACQDALTFEHEARIAVNLSPLQLNRPDLAERVGEILAETGLPPSRLELEITETGLIADKSRALNSLRQLKALGVSIAMDDFGTGYSSLETLNTFPFDKIKIDRSFLVGSNRNRQSLAIMRAIIALGKSLGIPVLCEGAETHEHIALLSAEGCQEVQGYFYGRPMPLEDILSLEGEGRASLAS